MAFDGSVNVDSSIDGSGFSKGLSKLGDAAKTAISTMTSAIGVGIAAIAGIATAAIKTGSDFESQMSRVSAISGATGSDLDALNKQAIQLGADTVYSATEAAQGMENLASAGFSTKEIMAAMPGMLNLAASSGEDLAAASDIAASTLREFNLSADQAGHVADVLAQNAAQTNAAVGDTGEAMKYVGTVASSAGWSLESVTAAIGEMANAGIKGSQAGTTLRSALTNLMDPSKQQKAAMDAIGFSAYDASGKMKSLSQMLSDLQKGTAGLTEQQRDQYIATIFGTDALSGMEVLINNGSSSLDNMTQSLVNSDGAAQKMADTMNDNLKGAVQGFTGSLESLAIEFYQSIDNPLKDVVKDATDYIGQLTTAFQTSGMQGLIGALGSVLSQALGQIAAVAPQVIQLGASLIQSLVSGIVLNAPSLAQSAVNIVTTLLTSVFTLMPQVLSAGGQLLLSFAQGITQQLPTLSTQALSVIETLITGLASNFPQIVQTAFQLVASLVSGIAQQLPTLIPEAVSAIITIAEGLIDNIDILIDAAIKLIIALAEGLINALPILIAKAPEIVAKLAAAIIRNAPAIGAAALELVARLWSTIEDTNWLGLGENLIRGLVDGIWSGISHINWRNIGNSMLNALKGVLGIHSPSTLFRDEIGKFLPPGIAIGFEAAAPGAIKDMQGQVDSMVARMQASVVAQQSGAASAAIGSTQYVTSNDNGMTVIFRGNTFGSQPVAKTDTDAISNAIALSVLRKR